MTIREYGQENKRFRQTAKIQSTGIQKSEMKDRKWDIKYVKKHFPKSTFKMSEGIGMAGLQP